jgi:hypothetical protein
LLGDQWTLQDLGTSDGIYLDRKRVPRAGSTAVTSASAGDAELRFQIR